MYCISSWKQLVRFSSLWTIQGFAEFVASGQKMFVQSFRHVHLPETVLKRQDAEHNYQNHLNLSTLILHELDTTPTEEITLTVASKHNQNGGERIYRSVVRRTSVNKYYLIFEGFPCTWKSGRNAQYLFVAFFLILGNTKFTEMYAHNNSGIMSPLVPTPYLTTFYTAILTHFLTISSTTLSMLCRFTETSQEHTLHVNYIC
jgi:hypothetical protein